MAEDDNDPSTTPGVGFQAQHVLGKTLKAGAIGALTGATLVGGFVAIAGGAALMAVPILGPIAALTMVGTGTAGAAVASAAVTGAMWGGGVGSGLGAIMGVGDVREATLEEQDRLEERAMRREARDDRKMALAERKEQQLAALQQDAADRGLTPGSLPYNRGQDGPAIG